MPDLHNLETFLNRAWQLASFFNQSIVESIVFITVHPRERLRNPLWYELIKTLSSKFEANFWYTRTEMFVKQKKLIL